MPTTLKDWFAAIHRRLQTRRRDVDAARKHASEELLEWEHAVQCSNERFEHPNELPLYGVAADVHSREEEPRTFDELPPSRSEETGGTRSS